MRNALVGAARRYSLSRRFFATQEAVVVTEPSLTSFDSSTADATTATNANVVVENVKNGVQLIHYPCGDVMEVTNILSNNKLVYHQHSHNNNNNDDNNNTVSHDDIHDSPKYSFYKRVMPSNLTALNSRVGRQLFQEAIGRSECYFPLAEQFMCQSEPAYCGISTLAMVLNALSIDPNVRWKGGWRWFTEDVLFSQCACISKQNVLSDGICLDQFVTMARCNGARISMFRPDNDYNNIDAFRKCIQMCTRRQDTFIVASFSREAINQTGDGHFSPIAAYHYDSDEVLILDVARFKYTPYWLSVTDLYNAMKPIDEVTGKSRGWFTMTSSSLSSNNNNHSHSHNNSIMNISSSLPNHHSHPRPAQLVGLGSETCPVKEIKIHYCPAGRRYRK